MRCVLLQRAQSEVRGKQGAVEAVLLAVEAAVDVAVAVDDGADQQAASLTAAVKIGGAGRSVLSKGRNGRAQTAMERGRRRRRRRTPMKMDRRPRLPQPQPMKSDRSAPPPAVRPHSAR